MNLISEDEERKEIERIEDWVRKKWSRFFYPEFIHLCQESLVLFQKGSIEISWYVSLTYEVDKS